MNFQITEKLFTDDALNVIKAAIMQAMQSKHYEVTPLHVVNQILKSPIELNKLTQASPFITHMSLKNVQHGIAERLENMTSSHNSTHPFLNQKLQKTLQEAEHEAALSNEKIDNLTLIVYCMKHNEHLSQLMNVSYVDLNQNLKFYRTKSQSNTKNKSNSELERCCINLTEKGKEDGFPKVIGYDVEIEKIIKVINKKSKRNCLLIGEHGVGKTSIVHKLTQVLASLGNKLPEKLQNSEVWAMNINSVLEGTKHRGAVEERFGNIVHELRKRQTSGKNIILFIDNIATSISRGGVEDDKAPILNLLKPLLDNEFSCIGTTTQSEYTVNMEGETNGLFQHININEPTVDETKTLLKAIKDIYVEVSIADDVIDMLVDMADRYIHNDCFPAKAINLLEEITSSNHLAGKTTIEAIDVAKAIEAQTNIPLKNMMLGDDEKAKNIEEELKKTIFGQDEAIATIARAIKRNRVGLSPKNRPICSFLLLGSTGTGKTALCVALAKYLFDSEKHLIRIDMSEFMQPESITKLIGTTVGYSGYKEGGMLTQAVKKQPYSVVLLDEMEKAHPDIFNLLLQVLDEGRLTDGKGQTVSFENTIIILTSNLGCANLVDNDQMSKQEVINEVKEQLRPELLNRLDDIIVFNSLGKEPLRKVVKTQIHLLENMLVSRNISLKYNGEVIDFLLNKGFSQEYGAREIRRTVTKLLTDPIADIILEYQIPNNTKFNTELNVICNKELDRLEIQIKADKQNVTTSTNN